MAVKLELYRVFRTVAAKGNISAAAQELYLSQSAVSQSIRGSSSLSTSTAPWASWKTGRRSSPRCASSWPGS